MAISSEQPLQPSPPPPPPPYSYPPIIIILSISLLLVLFIGFFSVYFCRCFVQNLFCVWHLRGSATATPVAGAAPATTVGNGLDPLIVESFPAFAYSTVKDYRVEKYGLECAICLLEFKDSDFLRLLPTCCHVFHQECIDLWLESHNTCPVCRKNLRSPAAQSPVKSSNLSVTHENEPPAPEPVEHHVSFNITINDENEDVRSKGEGVSGDGSIQKYPRSHSTGHSIIKKPENSPQEDRFTLRLPQHVTSRIIRGHNPSKSWSVSKDWSVLEECKNKESANKSDAHVTGDENV